MPLLNVFILITWCHVGNRYLFILFIVVKSFILFYCKSISLCIIFVLCIELMYIMLNSFV